MKVRRVLLTGAVVAALAGCGPAAPPPPAGGPPPDGAPPPPPDRATAEAYVADLRRIDPAIVGDGDLRELVDRGRDQCAAIRESPGDRARLITLTDQRFTAPEHPDGFGAEKAAAILDVIRARICPATG